MSEHAVYLYCMLRSAKAPALAKIPAGLPRAKKPRVVPAGESLWAFVADAPLAVYGEAQIAKGLKDLDWVSRCAVAHESVVEFAAKKGAVLPAKLFTMFLGDDRLLRWVQGERAGILRVLKRVEGCEEWGVRVSLDEAVALRNAEKRARAKAGAPTSGAGFLARKKEIRDATRDVTVDARASVDEIHDALAAKSTEARRRPPMQGVVSGPRLLLDGAYLIPAKKVAAFRREVEAIRKRLAAGGYDVVLTGPWPPYNFVADAA